MHCRTPVIIFLSDGEDNVEDEPMFDLCRGAVRRGFVWLMFYISVTSNSMDVRRPLSFHTVSFGRDAASPSLRNMVQIALDVQNNAPQDLLLPSAASVPSSYTEASDTVRDQHLFLHSKVPMQTFNRCA